jgi:hypothetical protein
VAAVQVSDAGPDGKVDRQRGANIHATGRELAHVGMISPATIGG